MKNNTIKISVIILTSLFISNSVFSQIGTKKNDKYLTTNQKGDFLKQLDEQVPNYLEEFIVPGAAIAIIKNGKIVVQKGFGLADVTNQAAVNEKTGFNIASISKTITAWGIMKLVEQGKLDLDSSAENYLTRWKIPKSNFNSKGVTIRRLLSHSSGLSLHGYGGFTLKDTLPTLEESLSGKTNGSGSVRLSMEPGRQYRYSGGGYTLLQLIVEEVTKKSFSDYMSETILLPLGMKNSSFKIDEKVIQASSKEHDAFGKVIDFEVFTAQAAAGFQTTIEDMAKFTLVNLNDKVTQKVLKQTTLDLMMTPNEESEGRYGLGYQMDSYHENTVKIVGHGGSNSGWKAFLQMNRETKDGIVILTNGASGGDLMNQVYCSWMAANFNVSMGNRCSKSIKPFLIKTYKDQGIEATITAINKIKKQEPREYFYRESDLNVFSYELLWDKKITEANLFFKFIVEEYPNSPNAYDSYAEGLLESGDTAASIEHYIRSINMDPRNKVAVRIIKKLGVDTDSLFASTVIKVSKKDLELIKGNYFIQKSQQVSSENPWIISFDIVNGNVYGNDRGYRYMLIPRGNNRFRNSDDGALIEFILTEEKAVKMMLFDKYTFEKE